MVPLPLLLVGLVVAVSVALILKNWRLIRDIEKLPGPLALPFIGSSYVFAFCRREELMHVFDNLAKQHWPIFRTWLGHTPEVHLMKPEHVEKIMTSSELITKAPIYMFLQPWLGDGLLTSTGAKWHSRRKMITPAFHFKILDNFIEIFGEKSEIMIDMLKIKADGTPFDIYPYITRCALDIICETAMGTSVDAQRGSQSDYVSAVYSSSEMTIRRGLSPWLHSDFIYKRISVGKQFFKNVEILHGFTKKVIGERKLSRQSSKQKTTAENFDEFGRKRRVAFLDMLLEASEGSQKLSDEAIQEEVDTFMFEGHDTTSVGMAWTIFLLGHHPDIQEKVFTELNDIFRGDTQRKPTMQDLSNMKYLEMVIKESLRLYPSVPFVGRKVTQDVEIGGFNIPEGTNAMLHIRKVHRDPDHWPDPDRFNPDNFLPENAQGRHPYAYVPFSAGLRNCIDFMEFVKKSTKKFWPIYRLWLGPFAEVRITKPEHIETVMGSSDLITKADLYAFLHPWLGDGLLTSTGTKWHARRKMITPAFHFTILDNFVEVFEEKAEVLVNLLKAKADGKAFDIYPYITRCTLDIICETAMGTHVDAQNNCESAYVNAVDSIAELTIKRLLTPWLQTDFIFRISESGKEFYKKLEILHGFTRKVIRDKKLSKVTEENYGKADETGRKRRVAFLDMLLAETQDGHRMTDQDIQQEVDTFMFEGHDTTSSAICWALVLLGHHPEIQDIVHAELKDIFQEDTSRGLTMQDLQNMKYLEMVIKETLRLYPSVPFIARKVTKEVELGGYRIPEGVTVTMQIFHTHRDPDHWPDPERFDPDRFLPERAQGRHPYAYVPFSAGPRNCIGQKFAILEEKTVLAHILRSFRVETVEKLQDLKLLGELVLRSFSGYSVRLTPR